LPRGKLGVESFTRHVASQEWRVFVNGIWYMEKRKTEWNWAREGAKTEWNWACEGAKTELNWA